MALTAINFKTTIQFDLKKFKLEDTTNYTAQSVIVANVKGRFVVIVNGNLFYSNLTPIPDINGAIPPLTNNIINLPLDGIGNVIQGIYQISYGVTDGINSIKKDISFTLDYKTPTGELLLTVDCVKPLLKSEDKTNYTVNGINPTIVRDHKILYPPTINLSAVTGTTAIVQTTTFFTVKNGTLQHSSTLTSDITYNFGTFFVSDIVKDEAFNDVSCDPVLCDIYCCLKAEYKRYLSFRGINDVLAKKSLANFNLMTSLALKIRIALECSKGDDVSALAKELLDIGGCEGCDCADGKPQLVTGLSGSSGTSVVVGTTPVIVTPTVAGQVTTFNVSFDSVLATKLNELEKINVIPSTGIDVTSAIVGGVKTFSIINTSPDTKPNLYTSTIKLKFGAIQTITPPIISIVNEIINGGMLKTPVVSVVGTWGSGSSVFTVKNFFIATPGLVLPTHNHIVQKTGFNFKPQLRFATNYQANLLNNKYNEFQFSILDMSGNWVAGTTLNNTIDEMTFSLLITV